MSVSPQIFGIRNSQSTRAAERFFKERRIQTHNVDLKQKPMSHGEIRRFVERFGLASLLDTEGKPYEEAGLKYIRESDELLLRRIEKEPRLLKLPLVRAGAKLSIGHDEQSWRDMVG